MNLTKILDKYDDPVTEYAALVIDGKIKTGKTERNICKRHIKDLERIENDKNFECIFDYSIAENGIIKFIEKYCKFTDGELVGEPVFLLGFQIFILGSIFGWVNKESGYRRFKQAYIQVARKNSKTLLTSWVSLYMLMGDGYYGAQVYTAANTKDQAKICWKGAEKTLRISKRLKKFVKITESTSLIKYPKKYSYIKALSSDTKNLDGFAPHCGVIDEYHAHKDNQVFKLLDDGTVMQNEPLIFIITTAGFDLDAPCYEEYLYCKKIVNGEKKNDNRFIYIAEIDKDDDIKKEENWLKANPLFRYLPEKIDNLAGKVKEGLDKPGGLRNMLTKTLNIWVDMKEDGYMELSNWRKCKLDREEILELCKGKECYVGLDLSQKHDLSSVTFEFPLDNNLYAVISRTFIPGERVKQKENTDGVEYSRWIKDGWIIPSKGLTIDNQQIENFILEFSEKHDFEILEINYDPYSATQVARHFEQKGYVVVEIRQGMRTLSEPTKDFREQVYNKNVIHEDNPVLNWNVRNAIEKADKNYNIQLDKSDRNKKIDGLAAAINAHVRAMSHFEREQEKENEFDINKYSNEDMLDKLWGTDD